MENTWKEYSNNYPKGSVRMNSLMSEIDSINKSISGLDLININKDVKDILFSLTKIVYQLSNKIEKIEEIQEEINEYVTVLDENLGNIEDELYGFQEEDGEFNSFDYIDVCCNNCNETLAVEKTLVNNENEILCPNCRTSINL